MEERIQGPRTTKRKQLTLPVDLAQAAVRVARLDDLPDEPDLGPVVLLERVHGRVQPAVERVLRDLAARGARAEQRLRDGDEVRERRELAARGVHRVQEVLVLHGRA